MSDVWFWLSKEVAEMVSAFMPLIIFAFCYLICYGWSFVSELMVRKKARKDDAEE